MIPRQQLFVPSKRGYVRGARPKVDCILCALVRRDPEVTSLELIRDANVLVTLNLFPYNPGHLMIVPKRHVTDPRALTSAERRAFERWEERILDLLDETYSPSGYNIGYNVGEAAGASIAHLHLHIVPRFRNEIGFIDVIGGARIHVDDPNQAADLLRRRLGVSSCRPKRKKVPRK